MSFTSVPIVTLLPRVTRVQDAAGVQLPQHSRGTATTAPTAAAVSDGCQSATGRADSKDEGGVSAWETLGAVEVPGPNLQAQHLLQQPGAMSLKYNLVSIVLAVKTPV